MADEDFDDGQVQGHVYVAYEPLSPFQDDDPLRIVKGVLRLVIWNDPSGRYPHVNIGSRLADLIRARLHGFPDGTSLYLVRGRVKRTKGEALWPEMLPIPPELSEIE